MNNINNNNNIKSLKKKKEISRYFIYPVFCDFNCVFECLSSVFKVDLRYSILTRVSYINRSKRSITEWKSLNEQIGLCYTPNDDLFSLVKSLHYTVFSRLEKSMEFYKYSEWDILGIQLIIYRVDYTNIIIPIQKFTGGLLGGHKDLVNVSKTSHGLNKALPLTINKKDFGFLLGKNIVNGLIKDITLMDGTRVNFLDRINIHLENNKKISNFKSNVDFYQKNLDNLEIIIIVYPGNKKEVYTKTYIDVYNINGLVMHHLVDEKIDSNSFSREIGKVKVYIDKTGIYKQEIKLKLSPVYPKKISGFQSKMIHPDWMVGTMDIETYKYNDELSKAYAVGFYVNNFLKTFYIGEDLNSDNLILKCLDAMLIEKYNRYTFYIHNMGRFDVVFILRVLIKANEVSNNTKYSYNLVFRDDIILALNISTKVNNKTYTIRLVDSYNLLQSRLSKLCDTFDTEVKKSYFPYEFVKKNNLFYIGDKPEIKHYNKIDVSTYNEIPVKNWSLEEQTIFYLKNDLISLFNVIDKFKYKIYLNYHVHVTKSLTISGLAMDIFLRRYYNNNIPLIKRKSIYNDIKSSYFGGVTEVYKPHGKHLYYYDVNSLYPYSALNPMPGLNCVYHDKINKNISELIEDLFGFYYCKIVTPSDSYLGLLPTRTSEGLIMPLGEIEGWYFSEELKFAYKHGYNIEIISGYKFDKVDNVFKKYVSEIYKIKSTTIDEVERSIAKSLLNNLLGRFGMGMDKFVTELVTEDKYQDILQTIKVRGVKYIGDKILVTHGKELSLDICNSHNVDFNNVFSNTMNSSEKIQFSEDQHHDISIAIASAVTSYSRIFMNEIKMLILSKGGNIYYMDTDSIVTDTKLDDTLVGSEIGKFKLVYEVDEAYFISSKTYCLKLSNGKIIIKAKGVYNELSDPKDDIIKPLLVDGEGKYLELQDFIDLYHGKNVKQIVRYETIKDYTQGSVTINIPNKITLSANSYTKRTKIFNHKNLWIDTKPVHNKYNKYHTLKNKSRVKEVFDTTLNTIISILICFLIAFLVIISYSLSEMDETFTINDNTDITNVTTDNITENSQSVFKQEFNSFVKLFCNKDRNIKDQIVVENNKNLFNHIETNPNDLIVESIIPERNQDGSVIIKKVLDLNYESANREIESLKDKISVLEFQLIKYKIDRLNREKLIESIIKDIDKELNKIGR